MVLISLDNAIFELNPLYLRVLVVAVRFNNRRTDSQLIEQSRQSVASRGISDVPRIEQLALQLAYNAVSQYAITVLVDDLSKIGQHHHLRLARGTEILPKGGEGRMDGKPSVGDVVYVDVAKNMVVRYNWEKLETGIADTTENTTEVLFSLPVSNRSSLPNALSAARSIRNHIRLNHVAAAEIVLLDSSTRQCEIAVTNDVLDADPGGRFLILIKPPSAVLV